MDDTQVVTDAPPADRQRKPESVTDIHNFRPTLVNNKYQAQLKCPGCDAWVITKNLRAFKEITGQGEDAVSTLYAEAFDVICENKSVPCGCEIGDIRLVGWRHSAPIDWRQDACD